MKIKIVLSLIATIVSFSFGMSQAVQAGTQNFGFSNIMLLNNSSELADVKGDPYYNSEAVEGLIIKDNGDKFSTYLRYNIFYDRMEFSDNSAMKNAKQLPKDESILVQLNTDIFKYMKIDTENGQIDGYFQVLAMKGKNDPAIIKKTSQRIREPRSSSRNSYGTTKDSKRLILKSNIYFMDENQAVEIENHKRKVLDSFPKKYRDDLKDFIKDNNISFSDDYRGVQEIVKEYYDLKS